MSYAGLGQALPPISRGNSNDGSPTRGNSNDRSPTRTEVRSPTSTSTSTEVRSPTSTSTSTEVRSPTSTSTDAYTRGNITVTGGAGAGAYTTVHVYQGKPGDYPERKGRAAGRTQERIVQDSIYGLMAPRPRGTPIPLQAGTVRQYGLAAPRPRGTPISLQPSTTQNVGLHGIGGYSGFGKVSDGSMSYTKSRCRRGGSGLMGLGAVADDQAPIRLGTRVKEDPILSTASVIASSILLRMAAVPKDRRIDEMVSILNAGQPGAGYMARADYFRRAAAAPDRKDQAMFDAIRATIANILVQKTLARTGVSGLGQTLAEARGTTSQGVNDAQAIFCTYVAGTVGMVGGFVDQLNTGGDPATVHSITNASTGAARTGGCGAGQMIVQADIATANARLAQSGAAALRLDSAAREASFMKYALIGGGLLGTIFLGYIVVKKMG